MIYLVVLPLQMQRGLKQTKVYHTFFFHFVCKEATEKRLKAAEAKRSNLLPDYINLLKTIEITLNSKIRVEKLKTGNRR